MESTQNTPYRNKIEKTSILLLWFSKISELLHFIGSFSFHSSCSLKDSQWSKWVQLGHEEGLHLPTPFLYIASLGLCSKASRTAPRAESWPQSSYYHVLTVSSMAFSMPLSQFLHPPVEIRHRLHFFYLLSSYDFLRIVYSFPRGNHCNFHFLIITIN